MWVLWMATANAQDFSIGIGTDPQLIDGTTRLFDALGADIGQILTCRDGAAAVEVWASKVGPESLTGGFSMEYLTGPRTYPVWAPPLDANALIDNWTAMTFSYANDVPWNHVGYVMRNLTVSTRTFDVFVNEEDDGGLVIPGAQPPLRGQLLRETYRSGANVVQYVDYWVFLEGYHAPQVAGDWVSVEPTVFSVDVDTYHHSWSVDPDVIKYARIAYAKPLANPGAWPAATWPTCGD